MPEGARERGRLEIPREEAKAAGFWTKKGLGQHLLRDATVVDGILEGLAVAPDEAVIEIGPGLGALTRSLLETRVPVLAIEVDAKACQVLREKYADRENFILVQADVLDCDLATLARAHFGARRFHVAANLPYYITTPILAQVLEGGLPFTRMVCLMQWEVGQRLVASPGTKDYSALTLMARLRCDVTVARKVAPGAFTPPPKVDSALVLFERLPSLRVPTRDAARLTAVVRSCFGKRRKTLRNGLLMAPFLELEAPRVDAALASAGIDPGRRAETLSLDEFHALTEALYGTQHQEISTQH